ncbi:glycosyl hydrolase (plasmid) [Cupriavidus necator]|uniref:Glycosyl hydrolase n=1 Tax=Cupriavidus necator TaxID=106590 RepID=A0A367PCW8_CUPNE|nr:YCF48-related protein [Cupriavidus necator]QQX89343.1 glycosyl hydrolase [Cupriavidus necator]RCJ05067.1 glycosyl hydrolase [Cupriavidus necator]
MIKTFVTSIALCIATAAFAQAPSEGTVATWAAKPAHTWSAQTHMMLLDATRAGKRIVAVGEHGIVLLSDDDGKTYRQARTVPVSATLSAVTFTDDRHGWIVGQWGVILATNDGGETWSKQRMDTAVDQPLFSVLFTNDHDGIAVGLWSLMLQTHDGGKTWARTTLPKPPGGGKADRNLYHVFADRQGALYVSAEQGAVLKSTDGGVNWDYLATGGKGSLWSGVAMPDGRIVVGGLLGSLFQSSDGGATWRPLKAETKSSVTSLATAGKGLIAVGLDGLVVKQREDGAPLEVAQRPDRAALTAALIDATGRPILFSNEGVLAGL